MHAMKAPSSGMVESRHCAQMFYANPCHPHCLLPTVQSQKRAHTHRPPHTRSRNERVLSTQAQQTLGMQPREALHLPEPKVQAAEHRRQVLSNLSAAGSIYVEVVTYDNDARSASIGIPPDTTYPVFSMQGGDLSVRNSDVMHAFRQHSNFAYLTGVHLPGYACLIDTQTGYYTLFAPSVDPQMIVWMGSQPSLDQLGELHGADACVDIKHLPAVLRKTQLEDILCLEQDKASVQRHFSSNSSSSSSSSSSNSHVRGGEQQNPLERALVASRAIKTKADIACLQHASDVSTQAHLAMWRACDVGMYEYQLEAEFVRTTLGAGLRHLGYPCIVGAGSNAATLHYESNASLIQADDLIMVDAGAEFRCFSADISRTFPATGTFTAAQRDLYTAVLQVQDHAISLCKSGKGWKQEVAVPSRKLYCQLLLDLGLAKGSVQSLLENDIDRVFMPHSIGHFLGMDVHDVSPSGPVPEQLQTGHVVTCEPGLYFVDHILDPAYASDKGQFLSQDSVNKFRPFGGIRIEDNIVVEQDGVLNLTEASGMFKSIDDVEANCRR